MPKISQKGRQMPASPIRKLIPYAEAAKQRGIRVIPLNIGQPDSKTPKIALDAVRNHSLEVLTYSQSEGSEAYRTKIAAYYAEQGISLRPQDLIVTTGGSEALFFALSTVMDVGDELMIPEPFYTNYNGFATACGATLVPVTTTFETNFALPPLAVFETLLTSKTKAILICNPANPTGYLYSKAEIQQLARWAKKHDLFLIADEVYREFTYDGRKHYSVLQEKGLEEHVLVIDSVSKRYSMCGARIGYLISRNPQVMQTALKFAQARLSPPTFAQMAAEAALATPQAYFDAVLAAYTERRNTLISGLRTLEGVRVAMPQGAFYCMVEIPVADSEDFARWLLETFESRGTTLMVAPAAGFYATPGLGKNQIRMAFVREKQELLTAVQLLGEALKIYTR